MQHCPELAIGECTELGIGEVLKNREARQRKMGLKMVPGKRTNDAEPSLLRMATRFFVLFPQRGAAYYVGSRKRLSLLRWKLNH